MSQVPSFPAKPGPWLMVRGCLPLQHVAQGLHDLVGGLAPSLGAGVDLLERVHDVFIVQGRVGLGQRGAIPGVEGRVPLLVLVSEAHHHEVALLDQGAGTDGVDLG